MRKIAVLITMCLMLGVSDRAEAFMICPSGFPCVSEKAMLRAQDRQVQKAYDFVRDMVVPELSFYYDRKAIEFRAEFGFGSTNPVTVYVGNGNARTPGGYMLDLKPDYVVEVDFFSNPEVMPECIVWRVSGYYETENGEIQFREKEVIDVEIDLK